MEVNKKPPSQKRYTSAIPNNSENRTLQADVSLVLLHSEIRSIR
jgi:hypothetical protein